MKQLTEEDKKNIELEMLYAFIYEMNSTQLSKMNMHAVKLLQDKRYRKRNLKNKNYESIN